jgi:hypothetical protein
MFETPKVDERVRLDKLKSAADWCLLGADRQGVKARSRTLTV